MPRCERCGAVARCSIGCEHLTAANPHPDLEAEERGRIFWENLMKRHGRKPVRRHLSDQHMLIADQELLSRVSL